MARKIDKETIEKIPLLYCELGVKKKVAEELGISVATVTKYLNLYEAAPHMEKEKKKRIKVTDKLIEEINKKYSEYKNMSKVAKELGISAGTVKRHLSEENLELVKNEKNDRDALWFYIYRLFGEYSKDKPVSDWNVTQMQKFRSQGMPYRGQLLALKYFYEVKKNTTKKSNGSIGIIPFIFSESKHYYENQAKKADEVTKMI